jgi:outer membrane protein assembly factor BamB
MSRNLGGLLLLVLAGPGAAAWGQDWCGFRGPAGALALDASPPVAWGEKALKWSTRLPGPGSSSPLVVGDRVFVTCFTGQEKGGAKLLRHLVCVDRKSGKIAWTADVPGHSDEDRYRGYLTEHGYASSTPACDGKVVYAFFGKAGVFAFDLTGKKLWQAGVGTGSDPRGWGSAASVVLYKNLVIVNAASESRSVRALDAGTGKEVWKAEGRRLELSFSTPALVRSAEGRTDLVVATPGELWGLNPDRGGLRWHASLGATGNLSPSVVAGAGVAYVTGGYDSRATTAVRVGGKGDVTRTHVLWEVAPSSYVPTPVLHDRRLTWVNEYAVAVSLDAKTGKLVYQQRIPRASAGAGQPVYASLVLTRSGAVAVTRRAGVVVLDAGRAFKVLAHNRALDGSDFNATPAACGKQLFLRSNRSLYCIEAE